MNNRIYVGCHCGWRGKRIWRDHDCGYEYCSHPGYGTCPNDGGIVYPVRWMIDDKKAQVKADLWWQTEGYKLFQNEDTDSVPV